MSEVVLTNATEREKGYLYYIDKEGNVCRAKMGRAKKNNPEPNPEVPTNVESAEPTPSAEQVVEEINKE